MGFKIITAWEFNVPRRSWTRLIKLYRNNQCKRQMTIPMTNAVFVELFTKVGQLGCNAPSANNGYCYGESTNSYLNISLAFNVPRNLLLIDHLLVLCVVFIHTKARVLRVFVYFCRRRRIFENE